MDNKIYWSEWISNIQYIVQLIFLHLHSSAKFPVTSSNISIFDILNNSLWENAPSISQFKVQNVTFK